VGFEPTPVYTDQNSHYLYNVSYLKLESGALDRSAILSDNIILFKYLFQIKQKDL
jgi:hypothetical protein